MATTLRKCITPPINNRPVGRLDSTHIYRLWEGWGHSRCEHHNDPFARGKECQYLSMSPSYAVVRSMKITATSVFNEKKYWQTILSAYILAHTGNNLGKHRHGKNRDRLQILEHHSRSTGKLIMAQRVFTNTTAWCKESDARGWYNPPVKRCIWNDEWVHSHKVTTWKQVDSE